MFFWGDARFKSAWPQGCGLSILISAYVVSGQGEGLLIYKRRSSFGPVAQQDRASDS